MNNHAKLSMGIVFLLIVTLCTTNHGMAEEPSIAKKLGYAAFAGAVIGGGYLLYNYFQETVNVWFRESVERGDDCSVINRYLTLGADVNTANPILGGDTVLIRAATIGHIDVVKCLLDNPQIKIDLTNDFGKTALMFAAQFDRYEIVNILLERGANINAVDTYLGYTALMYSVHDGSTDGIKALLDNPQINIEHQSKDGSTALLIAIQKKNKVIIKQLLDAGADPEFVNKDGITPLRAASGIKSFNMPEALEDPFARGLPRRSNLPIKIKSDPEILSLINKAIIKKHGSINPFIEPKKVNRAEVEKEI